jgi:anaerobic magnesium-protoporphyrin IX monomethyl ester cyclase
VNILLINPYGSNWVEGANDNTHIAVRMPPVGILSIAAYLLQQGHQIKVYDCKTPPLHKTNTQVIAEQIKEFQPQIVGFSAVTSSFLNAYLLAEQIKINFPYIKIVFGGVHVSALRAKILDDFPSIDFVVCGEGERAMADLAAGKPPENIQGLVYRQADRVLQNDLRIDLCDLDALPFPAYGALEGFPRNFEGALFNYPKFPVAPIISSRGCVYQCSYCDRSVYRRSFRFNSAEYLYEQMRFLKKDFGIKHIFFYDDQFTFNRERIVKLCQLLKKKPLRMSFNCAAHASHIDQELLGMLKSAGCWMISLGIESGAGEILLRHKTKADLAEMQTAVKNIQKSGLRAKGLFMMGLPGETEKTIKVTTDFIESLKLDDMNMTKFTPFPGSPIYQNIQEEGSFKENWKLMNCLNFVFIPKSIESKNQLDQLYKQSIRRFYTGKNWVSKFGLLCYQSPHSFWRLLKDLPEFLKIRNEFKSTYN